MRRHILPILLLLILPSHILAQEVPHNPEPFSAWLSDFRREALQEGITQKTLDEAFGDTTAPIERVIELDRKQPEGTFTLAQYLERTVNDKRVEEGRRLMVEHKKLLEEIGSRYNVEPKFIVALWGIETNFGGNTGGFSIIDSLATLAYDGRRSDFFRDELIKALRIIEEDHIEAIDMEGSWAGAMGQCQFMPSSFLQFAVDHDGDGKRDIWNNQADVFASIANYLSSSGWEQSGWGYPVTLPAGFNATPDDIKIAKPLSEWRRSGVRQAGGGELPDTAEEASLALVGNGADAVPYLVFNDYKVLLKWNRSRYFATAVGTLADNIGE
jgi:membrane-bound lytic murein transglycosylase B